MGLSKQDERVAGMLLSLLYAPVTYLALAVLSYRIPHFWFPALFFYQIALHGILAVVLIGFNGWGIVPLAFAYLMFAPFTWFISVFPAGMYWSFLVNMIGNCLSCFGLAVLFFMIVGLRRM